MALRWNIEKITNFKRVCLNENDELTPETHCLIFNCMAIGMGSITNKNLKEYVRRTMIYQQVTGALLKTIKGNKHIDRYITPKDIEDHVGLTTNVHDITKAKFRTKIEHWVQEEIKHCEWAHV